MTVSIYPGFRSGTGVGENDLRITKIVQNEVISNIDTTILLGSGEVVQDLTNSTRYEMSLAVETTPGYFYISDTECYIYGNKCTQISNVSISNGTDGYDSGVMYVPLLNVPDGSTIFHTVRGPNGYTVVSKDTGAAPINVLLFASGELSSLHAAFDTTIYSSTGIGGVQGYTLQLSGEVETTIVQAGEVPGWPAPVSPLSKVSVMSSYWNKGKSLLQNTYMYDPEYNRIIILSEEALNTDEVIIEYEGNNQPFVIRDINLSPTVTYPDNYIVCIDPEIPGITEDPKYIIVTSTREKIGSQDVADITFEVISERGNRIPNADVEVYITRKELSSSYIPHSPFAVQHDGSSITGHFDTLVYAPVNMVEADATICSSSSTDKIVYSCGYLTLSGTTEFPWELSEDYSTIIETTTGPQGIGRVSYISPSYIPVPIDIDVTVNYGTISKSTSLSLISDITDVYYYSSNQTYNEIIITSGELGATQTFVLLNNANHISLTDCGACTLLEYVSSLRENRNPAYIYPSSIYSYTVQKEWRPDHITEDINMEIEDKKQCFLVYNEILSGEFIMNARIARHVARGDMRSYYA